MAVTFERVKNYLRVDGDIDGEDDLILSLTTAAIDYVEKTTGKLVEGNPLCELCVKQLVAHWYENRAVCSAKSGATNEIPHTVTSLLTHIAQCEAYPKVGKT